MKVVRIIFFFGFLLLGSYIVFPQSKLLAPVYPSSKLSPLRSDKTESVFLSKDPIKKVEAFYSSKVGKLSDKDPLAKSFYIRYLGNTPVVSYGKTILTSNQISRQEGYPDPDAKDVGVLLVEKIPPKQEKATSQSEDLNMPAGMSNLSDSLQKKMEQFQKQIMKAEEGQSYSKGDMAVNEMSDLFSGLKNEVFVHRHSKKELIAVYNKYKFLDASFYPLIKNENGGEPVSYAHQLLKKYQNKIGNKSLTSDHWNYWVGFLKKLASHAYRTCIVINTKPSSWKK